MKDKLKECECCKRILKSPFGSQKFCNSCSLYNKKLKGDLSNYKSRVKKLFLKLKKIEFLQEYENSKSK